MYVYQSLLKIRNIMIIVKDLKKILEKANDEDIVFISIVDTSSGYKQYNVFPADSYEFSSLSEMDNGEDSDLELHFDLTDGELIDQFAKASQNNILMLNCYIEPDLELKIEKVKNG